MVQPLIIMNKLLRLLDLLHQVQKNKLKWNFFVSKIFGIDMIVFLKEVEILSRLEIQPSVDHIFTIPLSSGCALVLHITKKILNIIFAIDFVKTRFFVVFLAKIAVFGTFFLNSANLCM